MKLDWEGHAVRNFFVDLFCPVHFPERPHAPENVVFLHHLDVIFPPIGGAKVPSQSAEQKYNLVLLPCCGQEQHSNVSLAPLEGGHKLRSAHPM